MRANGFCSSRCIGDQDSARYCDWSNSPTFRAPVATPLPNYNADDDDVRYDAPTSLASSQASTSTALSSATTPVASRSDETAPFIEVDSDRHAPSDDAGRGKWQLPVLIACSALVLLAVALALLLWLVSKRRKRVFAATPMDDSFDTQFVEPLLQYK